PSGDAEHRGVPIYAILRREQRELPAIDVQLIGRIEWTGEVGKSSGARAGFFLGSYRGDLAFREHLDGRTDGKDRRIRDFPPQEVPLRTVDTAPVEIDVIVLHRINIPH